MLTLLIFGICNSIFFEIPIGELTQDTRAIMVLLFLISDLHIILRAFGKTDKKN